MALFDDRRFLLSHINHSFITGDDTGMCEMVMLDEDVFENQHQRCLQIEGQDKEKPEDRLNPEAFDLDYESDLFESELGQSYISDVNADLEYISHRRRSNTAQRLDKLKKEKLNLSKTTTIVWQCNSPTNSQSEDRLSQDSPTSVVEVDRQTTNHGIITKRSKCPPSKSGLTRLLERFPSLPKNPFDEFAQFDGGMSETVPVKKIMIFIAMGGQHQGGPIEVVIVSTARVQDLIGLACWQYTNEGREPKLNSDISGYCLRIAEDNGEVDPDFKSLNPKDPLSKYNFPSLALQEKSEERVRSYEAPYYPTIPPNGGCVIATTKAPNTSRFAGLIRIIFRDAKLETSQ